MFKLHLISYDTLLFFIQIALLSNTALKVENETSAPLLECEPSLPDAGPMLLSRQNQNICVFPD